jgi:hypothetical protein
MPFALGGVGWLVLCRINDAFSVNQQDMLIWNGLLSLIGYRCKKSSTLVLAKSEECGLLADGQACCN